MRIRCRLKTQLFLSVFKKIRVHTRTRKRLFEKFHFGDRLGKVPFSVTVSSLRVDGRPNRKTKLCFKKFRIRVNVALGLGLGLGL